MLTEQSQPQLTNSHLKKRPEQKSTYILFCYLGVLIPVKPIVHTAVRCCFVLTGLENLLSVLKSVLKEVTKVGRRYGGSSCKLW